MINLQQELMSGKRKAEHEKDYGKFFEVKQTPVRGVRVMPRQGAMDEAKSRFGFFVLLSNTVKTPRMALEIYRNKDVVKLLVSISTDLWYRFEPTPKLSKRSALSLLFCRLTVTSL